MFRRLRILHKLSKRFQNEWSSSARFSFDVTTNGTDLQKQSIYLIDDENGVGIKNEQNNRSFAANKYTIRNFTCGNLRLSNVGQRATICGWLHYSRMDRFLILRDAYGECQCMIRNEDQHLMEIIKRTPLESVLKINGTILARPKEMINNKLPTGEIEVLVEHMVVLNRSKEILPFNVRDYQKAKESLGMQYRYLAMRFADMQHSLRVRSKLLMAMRNFLANACDFVEIETPTLFKATPGGAQEFVVPTRDRGRFYSLVQSPQQFKQMLMGGGCDRYFQVARCYRDEGSRSDRQPEFTQMDIELSFTNRECIINLIEDMFNAIWPDFLPQLPQRFKRLTYVDAIETYGTDKPDVRYGYTLKNCSHLMRNNATAAYGIVFEKDKNILSKSVKEELAKLHKQHAQTKFLQIKYENVEDFARKTSKLFDEDVARSLVAELDLKPNFVLFMGLGSNKNDVLNFMGKVRTNYVRLLNQKCHDVIGDSMEMLWIVDFPLIERTDNHNGGVYQSVHHPFTAVHPDDVSLLREEPLKARSQAYDLVLNGHEIAGGSIRIHEKDEQTYVLDLLGIRRESLGHMLEMLQSGCPPHGGIAIGIDRLLSVMLNKQSIRDVIAFPKTFEGRDPLSGAPCPIDEEVKRLYHIDVK